MKILFFGPNGSGKGTQGAIVKEKYGIPHIETGVIFRDNISKGTDLGKEAKGFIDRGELVPDSITIPMILDRLKADDCKNGWLLDGFPRNLTQAEELDKALSKEGIKLAELHVGDTFGEEALISDAKRNATVTMKTDGSVMRLGKEDFNKLLNEPMLEWVTHDEAQAIVQDGGQWLDVRLPSEFENQHLDGAINIPLYFIRLKISTLDADKKYVVCCDTGRRSSAGAYILSERGYKAYVLRDGINSEPS